MPIDEVQLKIQALRSKLLALLEKHELAVAELDLLRVENKQLEELIQSQNEELKSFKNRDKISKIVGSVAEEGNDVSELKSKLNEYIREIDKCINYLSS